MKTKRILAAWLASLAAILLVGPATIQAQDLSYSELVARLTALESELQSQRMDFASYNTGGGPEQYGGKDSKSYCADPSWYAGYEITFLQPFVSQNGIGPTDNQFGVGHRFVAGYDNGTGLGARLRYWMYNHGMDNAAGAPIVHLDLDVLYGEVTLQERMHNWDLLVSGGLRYARIGFEVGGANFVQFEGLGPTVSLEATREIGSRGFYLVGNFRASVLYGHLGGVLAAEDETALAVENQLGLGWSRCYGGGVLNVRGVWESQYWYNASLGDDVNGLDSALGLTGPSFSAEYRY